ncbi:hypothetical protein NX722_07825 [Endozoicomonas gorgoniicola]|uniref:DNA-binding protein n=1 Tax=Endozoicomonas gorgoniicola TaxID=1234144 RepID=A0ABT3MT62_9GAMM|nr:hypothetical protein [Endozoicomonas gorgoniicola]MCW7552557.1 hypothetical protein [Endozoicomonas gorgoniicola]
MVTQTIELAAEPGALLYRQVKAGFCLQGLTFKDGCEAVGVNRENARKALFGLWNGPKAELVRVRLYEAAGFSAEG